MSSKWLYVLPIGRDLEDSEGVIGEWLTGFGASWVILRPDRFVIALGVSGGREIRRALDPLHRNLGPATSQLVADAAGKPPEPSVVA